jgi:hypothetical protein
MTGFVRTAELLPPFRNGALPAADQWVERLWPGVKSGNFPGNLNNAFLVATPEGLEALPNAARSMWSNTKTSIIRGGGGGGLKPLLFKTMYRLVATDY